MTHWDPAIQEKNEWATESRTLLAKSFVMPDAEKVAGHVNDALLGYLEVLLSEFSEPWVDVIERFLFLELTEAEVATARAYRDCLRDITDRVAWRLRGWVIDKATQHRVYSLTQELFGILLGTDNLTLALSTHDDEQIMKRDRAGAA